MDAPEVPYRSYQFSQMSGGRRSRIAPVVPNYPPSRRTGQGQMLRRIDSIQTPQPGDDLLVSATL